jgi:uncharacterized membrane protein YraQ (UPF0718 family)
MNNGNNNSVAKYWIPLLASILAAVISGLLAYIIAESVNKTDNVDKFITFREYTLNEKRNEIWRSSVDRQIDEIKDSVSKLSSKIDTIELKHIK